MKILMMNAYGSRVGGIEAYLHAVMDGMQMLGHKTTLVYSLGDSPSAQAWNHHRIPFHEDTNTIRQALEEFVRALNPDAIIVHSPVPSGVWNMVNRLAPTSFFLHAHYPLLCAGEGKFWLTSRSICQRRFGPYCIVAPWFHRCGSRHFGKHYQQYQQAALFRSQIAAARHLLVASEYMADSLRTEGIPTPPIHVVPLGLPDQAISEVPPLPAENQPPQFLFPARLVEGKGGLEIITALQQVINPIHLVIAGDGRQRAILQEKASRLPPRHRVTFTGWLDAQRMEQVYRNAQVVLMPSLFPEPFGLVGLEAMAAGRPVIAHDVGGVREWLVPEHSGILLPYPPHDSHTLAQAMDRLAGNPALGHQMGINGWQAVRDKFRMRHHIEALISLISNT